MLESNTNTRTNQSNNPPAKQTSNRLSVIKRDGNRAPYTQEKIAVAITKAILAVEGSKSADSSRIKQMSQSIAVGITDRLNKTYPSGGSVNIEDIQDHVELGLMRNGMQQVARAYVLYREEHARQRQQAQQQNKPSLNFTRSDGSQAPLDLEAIHKMIAEACRDLQDVDAGKLVKLAYNNLYNGIKEKDIVTALIMAARPLIESEPNYSFVCARLLLDSIHTEVINTLELDTDSVNLTVGEHYPQVLEAAITKGVALELMDEALLGFDIQALSAALNPERDLYFGYLGLQTLYDRYFLHSQGARIELPQTFFMRVAMGLALNEDKPTERAIEFYKVMSSFDYMSSTPTLFNAGTKRPQLSSCYLSTIPDDLAGIYDALKDNALLSKWAGGLGNDWSNVRALGSHIKGTNGQSQGVVPFLKVVNDTAVAVNQGGKRKGAVCAYLESWHLDIEDFLDLRKNTGDERRRTHDMNSANWIPDLFMKRVFEEGDWILFSPDDVPDLHDLTGRAFEERYEHYERQTQTGEIKLFKRIAAQELWRKMLSMLFETGHPWITFKDPCNIRSPQQHVGVVHSSNLCTEITLNTSKDEIAVCNLGSVNLLNHIHNGELDHEHLKQTITSAIRMLDNVIDINYYACPQAENSNLKHRPIGLGLMGFQDALYKLGLPYASIEAVYFADQSMELISYLALEASALLASERGAYQSYSGSLWSQGILPIDSQRLLREHRGEEFTVLDFTQTLDWQPVRELIATHGIRNSNVMAIAPTATISNIVGVAQSIEPTYQNLFVKSNLSGEFTVINPWLVKALKQNKLWDSAMLNDLKFYDGCLNKIERIPEDIKALFSTAFEIDSHWLVEAAARRQKWIDQGQSLNLYMSQPSGKQLDSLYKTAWTRGLKTTYYLRSLGATQMEKNIESRNESAVDEDTTTTSASQQSETAEFSLGEAATAPQMCSILEPDCEACQ